jgi:hypothetical protein
MQASPKTLPFLLKFLYGSGEWGISSIGMMRSIFYAIYLTDVVGLEPRLASFGALTGIIWDAVNDPLVGYLSDHLNTRWGRRRLAQRPLWGNTSIYEMYDRKFSKRKADSETPQLSLRMEIDAFCPPAAEKHRFFPLKRHRGRFGRGIWDGRVEPTTAGRYRGGRSNIPTS